MPIPDIEKASQHEIESFQAHLLQKQLLYLYEKSTFYKKHFQKHKINPKNIQSLADLALIPSIGKQELQSCTNEFICVERSSILDYCSTSGTEGKPVTIPLTENDLQRVAYNEYLSLGCANPGSEELYQLTTTADRQFMAGLAYVMGARMLKAGMVRVGPGLPELQWKTIEEVQPTTLIIVPSFLNKLVQYAEENNIDYKSSSVEKAICIGEPIRKDDFNLNLLGEKIKKKWDIKLFSTYASTEMATAFTECEAGKGGHFHPELIITELLDENDNEVQPGDAGELTITTLGVEGMPLIRFRTGDICRKHVEPCSCGRTTYRLGPIICRKNQMIKYKGTTLFPSVLADIMDNAPFVKSYVIEVSSNEFNNDDIKIIFHGTEAMNLKSLIDQFKVKARVTPQLIPASEEEVHKLMFPGTSRKPIRFIDKRNKQSC
ncbi:AMP-binding protein [Cytophagaceae bacterium ABcell3]|nr:AMP-binding protein [Cytophagaceae bacterium ABcell3]